MISENFTLWRSLNHKFEELKLRYIQKIFPANKIAITYWLPIINIEDIDKQMSMVVNKDKIANLELKPYGDRYELIVYQVYETE